jgi:hypothetical protein
MATRKKVSSTSASADAARPRARKTGARVVKKAVPARTTRRRTKSAEDEDEVVAGSNHVARVAASEAADEDVAPKTVAPRALAPATAAPPPASSNRMEKRAVVNAPTSPVRAGPRPFVVARGEDPIRVFSETLKHSGFFEAIENAQIKSGKRRELYEVACKVDFMRAVRVENEPVSYVDPRLVKHLFDQLLDRGFRILRVVEVRNELSRYLVHRSVKEVGKALGYDESCYELRDLADELTPIDLGAAGRRATGRIWKAADYRIVFAKNRTDEAFGPALALWNVWHTLATPTDLIALEYGIDPSEFTLAMVEKCPVHFAMIDAIHARDGSPGNVVPYDALRDGESGSDGAQVHRPGTILAGTDLLAVEAAGQRMQGVDPGADPIFLQKLRKATGWRPPTEVEGLPQFPGWKGIGTKIRDAFGADKLVENTRVGLYATLSQVDGRLFSPQPSAFQLIRLRLKVEQWVDDLRRRKGLPAAGVPAFAPDVGAAGSAAAAGAAPSAPPPANPASFGE